MQSTKIGSRSAERLRQLGFKYVTIDLEGYRTGSMTMVRGIGIE